MSEHANGTAQQASTVDAEVVNADPWYLAEDEGNDLVPTAETGVAAINRSEVDAQVSLAKKYPRSVTRFVRKAIEIATRTVPIAESCIYALPRAGKPITGPSIRLAEIVAGAYQNLHAAARVMDAGDVSVTAQGVAWDLENNVRITTETQRRITNKKGERFNDDMILMTGNAAASIALRNAIFRVVPRAYVDEVYQKVRDVAVGKASTMIARRDEILARLAKMGATIDRVLPALGVAEVGDITADHMEALIGYGTAIKNGDKTVDQVFPAIPSPSATGPASQPAQEGRRVSTRRGDRPGTAAAATGGQPSAGGGAAPTAGGPLPTREALDELINLRSHVQIDEEAIAKWFGKTAFGQFTAAEVNEALVRLNHVDNGGKLNSKGEIVSTTVDKASDEKPAEEKPTEPAAAAAKPKFEGGK